MTVEMWASFGGAGGTAPLFYFGDQRINSNGLVNLLSGNGAPGTALPNRGRYSIAAYSRPSLELNWSADDPSLGGELSYTLPDGGALDNTTNRHLVFELNPTAGTATIYVDGVPTTATNMYLPLLNTLVDNYNYIGIGGDSGYLPAPPGTGMNPAGGGYVSPGGTTGTNNMVVEEFRIWNGILPQSNVVMDYVTGPTMIVTNIGQYVSNSLVTPAVLAVGQSFQCSMLGYCSNSPGPIPLSLLYWPAATFTSDNPGVLSSTPAGLVTGVNPGFAQVTASVPGFPAVSNVVEVYGTQLVMHHRWSFNVNSGPGGSNWDSVQQVYNATNMGNAHVTNGQLVLTTNGPGASTDYEALPPDVIASTNGAVLSLEAWASFTNSANHGSAEPPFAELWSFGTTNSYGNAAYYLSMTPHSDDYSPLFQTPQAMLAINPTDPGPNAGPEQGYNTLGTAPWFGPVYQAPGLGEIDAFGGPILDGRTNVHIAAVFHPLGGFMQLWVNGLLAGTNTLGTNLPTALDLMSDTISCLGRSVSTNTTLTSSSYLNGTIDELRIYSGLLDAQQVAMDDATGPNDFVDVSAPPLRQATPWPAEAISLSPASASFARRTCWWMASRRSRFAAPVPTA